MPGQNGTGPLGDGPMTGRGLGPCGGGMARGRSFGAGRGYGWFGRGMGRLWPNWSLSDTDRKQVLQDEAKLLEKDLADIKSELSKLKKSQNKKG